LSTIIAFTLDDVSAIVLSFLLFLQAAKKKVIRAISKFIFEISVVRYNKIL
jgi:hypothetical protein